MLRTSFAPAPPGFGILAIRSEPDSAEIYIDGEFHGNAPATLKLPAGSHTIVLKAAGLSAPPKCLPPANSR